MANVRVARSSVSEVSLVLFTVLVLVGFGIIMVFSSTMASETDYLTRHLVFVAAGLGLLTAQLLRKELQHTLPLLLATP